MTSLTNAPSNLLRVGLVYLVKHSPLEETPGVAVSCVDRVDGKVVPLDAIYHGYS